MITRELIFDFQQGASGGSELRGKGVEAKWKKVLGVSMAIGRSAEFLVILCRFGLFWRKVLGVSMANWPLEGSTFPSFWGILGYSWLYLFILGYSGFISGYFSS